MPNDATPDVPAVLFSAFEPSGDAHAAPVIAALRERLPQIGIFGVGGPRMAAAGATLIEETATDGAMGLGAFGKLTAVRATIGRIRGWATQRCVAVHVPVDSPAANFPLCKALRSRGVRTVHLVAPQLWAWAPWRIRKLRRLTDLVLCLLPFEEEWFTSRGVPARFIGHPAINRDLDEAHLDRLSRDLPHAHPRLALFPGSRGHEVEQNGSLLLEVFRSLRLAHPAPVGCVVAAREGLIDTLRAQSSPGDPPVVCVDADAAVRWCDVALTVSGTMSLNIARQAKPMVGVYRLSPLTHAMSRRIIRAPHRLLPNIIAGRTIVPEFVPWSGGAEPIRDAVQRLLDDPAERERQSAELQTMLTLFDGRNPGAEAAECIARFIENRDAISV